MKQQQQLKPKTKLLENHRKAPPINTNTSPQNQTFFFPSGSEVEVTSDEEGFKGAWYSATVVEPPPSFSLSSSNKEREVYVEYKTLLSDENGSTLLREFVKVEFVRPKPPVDEKKGSFEVNDVVDAFYQDGWWSGVVTQLVGEDMCSVFFSSPPDELLFHLNDLRFHKDWVHGNWVRPPKQRMRDLKFTPGTAVEVNIDPDNSGDVWFPATLLKQISSDSFLIEYQESKEAEVLKVTVDSLHIRPPPPRSSDKAFNLLEKVYAFNESRWLSGVVTKILADGKYIVYFKRTKKEKELSHANLRLHMEWNNGKWIQSSQDTSMKSITEKQTSSIVNGGNKEKTRATSKGSDALKNNVLSDRISTPNLRSSQKELQTSSNEKPNHRSSTPSKKRVKKTSANGGASNSRPPKTNEEPASDVALSHDSFKSKLKLVEASNYGTSADLDSPTSVHRVQLDIKQSEDKSQPSDPTEVKDDNENLSASRKRARPQRVRGLASGDSLKETVVETPSKSDTAKSPLGPVVVGLTHDGKMIDSYGNTSSQHLILEHKKAGEGEEKNVDDHESFVSNESEQQKDGEVTNLKRKRGRPPKESFQVGSPKINEAECVEQEKKENASDAKDDDEKEPLLSEVEKPISVVVPSGTSNSVPDHHVRHVIKINDPMKRRSDIHGRSMSSTSRKEIRKRKASTGSDMHDLSEPLKSVARKGKKQKSSKQSQTEDAMDDSRIKVIEVFSNGIDRAVAGTSSNASDDDKPLSAWFDGAVSPLATDFRSPPGGTVNQSDGSTEREEIKTALVGQTSVENVPQVRDRNGVGQPHEVATQSHSTAIVPVEERDLPFVKNSLIWQLFDSMEILKRIPQKPHFRPLYNCKEECREGLAIGSMVTFTSLVERISKSRFSDSRTLLDGYLEALVDLEELGFNVSPVREQLNKLMSLKDNYEQAENTAKEIESQIMERNLEKSTITGEMADLDRKIAELMEKRAIVMLKNERKEAEIVLLQTSIDAVKGTLDTAEKEFEKITSSLW